MAGEVVRASARELTEEQQQEIRDKAFALEASIKKGTDRYYEAWWSLAADLYAFHEMRGWEVLGYDSVAEWLAQPEIAMKRADFNDKVTLWRDYHESRQVPAETLKELPPAKAKVILPALMAGDVTKRRAVNDAQSLSMSDVIEKYRVDGQPLDSGLDASKEPERIRCPACGSWTTEDDLERHGVIDGAGRER